MSPSEVGLIVDKVTAFFGKIFLFNILSPFTKVYSIPFVVGLVLFSAVFFNVILKGISFRRFLNSISLLVSGEGGDKVHGGQTTSSIGSLFAIIAGSTGLGGIVGISSLAIVFGPGVAFWVLFVPFIITPVRYAEVFLAHKYRVRNEDGSFYGGPSVFLKSVFGELNLPLIGKGLAFIYGVFLLLASLGGASSYQSNQIVRSLILQFPSLGGKEVFVVLILIAFVSLVVFRNLTSVVKFLSFMAPITIVLYFCAVFAVIAFNHSHLLASLKLIFAEAFDFKNNSHKIFSGMLLGMSRIVLATEVGLGTASVMHSSSANKDSIREGILSMASPFISTFFVGFATLFAVIVSGAYKSGLSGVDLLSVSFATVHPQLKLILVSMVPLMGISVIIAWSAYGANSAKTLFGSSIAAKVFLVLYMGAVFVGGVVDDFGVVLRFCDVVNISMAAPNIIGLLFAAGIVRKAYEDYRS